MKHKKPSKRDHDRYISYLCGIRNDYGLASKINPDPQMREVFRCQAAILEARICVVEAKYKGTPKAIADLKEYLRGWAKQWCSPEECANFDEWFAQKYESDRF